MKDPELTRVAATVARQRGEAILQATGRIFESGRSLEECLALHDRQSELYCLLAEKAYAEWDTDAAFYLLRAALSIAESADALARVQRVALFRRDEALITGETCLCSEHGVWTTRNRHKTFGFRDSYEQLLKDCDLFAQAITEDCGR